MNAQAWQIRIALGTCRAARLLALSALALALFALVLLTRPLETPGRMLAALTVLALLPALYLGLRLEIDRVLFQRLVHIQDSHGDARDALAALDEALAELGWQVRGVSDGTAPRPLAARVAGVVRLVKWLGGVVAVQVLLVGVASLGV